MATDAFGLVGTTIDNRYRIDAVVGEGGFGVVYRGYHLAFKRAVAVKCLKVPRHFSAQGQALFLEKFREEGALLSGLAHPSIVRVFDFSVTDTPAAAQVPYLVLEWLEGRELQAVLDELRGGGGERPKGERPKGGAAEAPEESRSSGAGALSEAQAIALLRPAIDALAIVHAEKIAHRDLKPANLFEQQTPKGKVLKVLDFGIAKAMQEGETATQLSTKTSSGFSAFSPSYGAPEQFITKRFGATGPWTDVHALGLILVELVSGRRALDGDETIELYESCTSQVRPTPRTRGATVSDAFEALCEKALALDPKARFRDAGELGRALDALGSEQADPARSAPEEVQVKEARTERPSKETIAAAPIQLVSSSPAPSQQAAPGRERTRYWLAAGVGAIAIVLIGIALSRAFGTPDVKASATAPPTNIVRSSVASVPRSAVAPRPTPPDAAPPVLACPVGMVAVAGDMAVEGVEPDKPAERDGVGSFCVDLMEVTVSSYKSCVSNKRCSAEHMDEKSSDGQHFLLDAECNYGQPAYEDQATDRRPINCISWDQADAYCRAKGARLPSQNEVLMATMLGDTIMKLDNGTSEWTATPFCEEGGTRCPNPHRGNWRTNDIRTIDYQYDVPSSRSPTVGFRCAADVR